MKAADDKDTLWAALGSLAVGVLLVAAGVGVGLYANSIRTSLHATSTVCVVTDTDIGDAEGRREDEPQVTKLSPAQARICDTDRIADGLRLGQLTVKREPPSDTLLSALFGAALALVFAGAFYPRIESVTVAGLGFKVKRGDARASAKAVVALADELPEPVPPQAVEGATRDVQDKLGDLREYAAGKREIPPIEVPGELLPELRRGNPLPEDLLKELADRALKEQLEHLEPGPGGQGN